MFNWFKDNSVALQGIASLLGPLLTIGIALITWRYVLLTNAIARTMHLQLSAALQPVIDVTFGEPSYLTQIAFGRRTYDVAYFPMILLL